MKRIAAIGELLWDVFPNGKRLGGAPMNFAYWATKSGCQASIVSAVGRDLLGKELLDAIKPLDVDLSALQINDSPTGTVEVSLSASGEPDYRIRECVAWDRIVVNDESVEVFSRADAVCWGSLVQRTKECKAAVLELVDSAPKTALRVFDVNLREHFYTSRTIEDSLRRADVLKLNELELPVLEKMFAVNGAEGLRERFNLRYVIYTLGDQRSEILSDGCHSVIPTPKVEVASTVGAGDSFTATFTASLINGADAASAHQRAVEVSAEVCRHDGAMF